MNAGVVVDGRWLEPPEPMERILMALDVLRPGQTLRFLIHREPIPLYPALRDQGYDYVVRPIEDGCFEVLITHRPDTP